MKNYLLRRIVLPCVALMLVICMVLTGCASRRSVSAEEFTAACESASFTPEDIAANYDANYITDALLYTDDSYTMAYFNFSKASEAKSQYAQIFSSIYMGTSDEKYIDSTEYNRYYASNGTNLALVYRNGANLIYVIGTEDENLLQIIENLGI